MKIFAFYYKMRTGESTYTLLYIIYADSEHLHFPKIHLVSHEALVAKSSGSFVYSTQFIFSKKKKCVNCCLIA